MKVTIDGITYEGTEDEIRRIVENPPTLGYPQTTKVYPSWPPQRIGWPTNEGWPWDLCPVDFPRKHDYTPRWTLRLY